MTIWEVQLRCQYQYPLVDISRQLPGTPINVWRLWDRAMLQVPSEDNERLERVAREIVRAGGSIEEFVDNAEGRVFIARLTFPDTLGISELFEAAGCMVTPPWYFQDGWAHARAVAFDEASVKQLFRALEARGRTELVRKSELPLAVLPSSVWVHALLGGLTERQVEALCAAYRSGYYRFPRSIETDRIAEEVGLARTTFSEHLRKAENRLVDSMMPYIQVYGRSVATRRKRPTPAAAGVRREITARTDLAPEVHERGPERRELKPLAP